MGAGGEQTNGDSNGMASDATFERVPAEHNIRAAECCHAREIAGT